MRSFQIYDGDAKVGDAIKAESIMANDGQVSFYGRMTSTAAYPLIAVIVLAPGMYVKDENASKD